MKQDSTDKDFREVLREELFKIASIESKKGDFSNSIRQCVETHCPDSLFRYRQYTDNNLDAFKEDKMYLATPASQNDPYDNLYFFDDFMLDLVRGNMEFIENNPNHGLAQNKELIDVAVEFLQHAVIVACYTDKYDSMLMWSHYAQNHEGYLLEYSKDDIVNTGVDLFPVLYSRERYNACRTINYMVRNAIAYFHPNIPHLQELRKIIERRKPSEYEKIISGMVKSPDWSYENEWRHIQINDILNTAPKFIEDITPIAIYYGSKMADEDKDQLHEIAQSKGIKEYQMYVDFASSEFALERKEL